MKDKTEEKLIKGLQAFDRLEKSPPSRESINLMITEIRQRQKKELIWFLVIALLIVSATVLILVNEPVLYAAGQLLFLAGAGIVLYVRKSRVKQHE
ncbi:hypothetical protein JMA_00120 [Jeotgalibacillus malaysiensis]|uniref:YxlC family protein n=1 Tax=Jeotgalibacillus malaysiensis TaxID=1508404 RepID=A0A0B5AMY2_9BACL|nr:DUF5345 family protein [Jeotgalibacillus malaysiensis]AJD89329.1 hypothetical protein JMA_00120 [Jeotgalibacillus malaysiensis]